MARRPASRDSRVRCALVALLAGGALAACPASEDDYPIVPGGDGVPIAPGVDAAVPDGPQGDGGDGGGDGGTDPSRLVGRVCLLGDLRVLTACAPTGAGGLTVQLGTSLAITGDSGAFSIPLPTGDATRWRVFGGDVVTSVMVRDDDAIQIPVISTLRYAELASSNGVLIPIENEGAIVVRVTRQGAPLPNAIVNASPVPAYATLYDGVSPLVWEQDATGPAGVAWLPGVGAGNVGVAVTPPLGAAQFGVLPVEDQALTFATVEFP